MKLRSAILSGAVTIPFVLAGSMAEAEIIRTFSWTAADLLDIEFVNGEDGTTAAENGLFDGARRLRDGSNRGGDTARTFIESQHDLFNDRFDALVENDEGLNSFNLWGLDGRGAEWGEDFKPLEWVSIDAPDGWETGFFDAGPDGLGWFQNTDPTQSNFVDFNTPLFPFFETDGAGIPLAGGSGLENLEFSVTIRFDETDAFFGQETHGAPNDLNSSLTFYFGGFLTSDDIFEGNVVLQAVPVPATIGLFGFGVLGLSIAARRRRFAAKAR